MTYKKPKYGTREEWLNAAVVLLNPMLAEKTALRPKRQVLVSAGWPRRDRGGRVIGQCYNSLPGEGANHIFISPMLSTATDVLPTLLHELIHAADDCESQHKGPFRAAWKALGFIDKPTLSVPGPELKAALREIAGELGAYPHKKLNPITAGKPQTTRMLKVECPSCGCVVRMTRRWLDEAGAPECACGTRMDEVA
jgi:hypothetical protein